MGRIIALVGLGIIGFIIGFVGFIALNAVKDLLVQIYPFLLSIEAYLLTAIVSGIIGSIITIVAIVFWSYSSKHY